MNMKKKILLSAMMSVVTFMVMADEYIDPQTNVIYTYEPGQTTASVKAGYGKKVEMCPSCELDVIYRPDSPDAAGDVVILDRFTVGTAEYVVTSIGDGAFMDNRNINSVSIPETVSYIGTSALTSVTIPDGVTTIGLYAFRGCDGLASVTIPSSITTIESGAFLLCSNLNAVYISDLAAWCRIPFNFAANPLLFDAHLYLDGEEVTDLVIPEGVTSISYGAFQGCTHFTSATIPNGVTSIDSYAFDKCSGLISVSFPTSLDKIGYSAFSYCSSLFNVTIPEGVTSIGNDAFRMCWNLSSVISLIEEPFGISNGVFELYNSETYESSFTSATLYVPKGCKSRYEATAGWKRFTNIVEMDGAGIDAVRIADSRNSGTNTYDLMGRHLNSQLQKGLYIQNGKKILK